MFVNYNNHVALVQPFDQYTPKVHLLYHMLACIRFMGNPRVYANWIDEDLNKSLKQACRNCSQLAFERTLLLRFKILLRTSLKRPATT